MSKFYLLLLTIIPTQALTKWSIDKEGRAHIKIEGKTKHGFKFHGREILPQDLPYMFSMYTNSTIMRYFGNGQPRQYEAIQKQMESWLNRWKNGNIASGIILFDEKNNRIGFIVLGNGDSPGCSELAYALMDERSITSERVAAENLGTKIPNVPESDNIWGKGIIGEATKIMMKEWLPNLLPRKNKSTIIPSAQFVFGAPLTRIDSTTSISNLASVKIIIRNGFKPATDKVKKILIIFDSSKILDTTCSTWPSEIKKFEKAVLNLFLNEQLNLETGTRYLVMDGNKAVVTISWHPQYNILKTHWEIPLTGYELPKTALDLSKIDDDTTIIANQVDI